MLRSLRSLNFVSPLWSRSRSISDATKKNEYDYVIIGAGSAGCVLTHRLTSAGNNVCLIEAGPPDEDMRIHMPLAWTLLFYDKTLNWNYWTVPQKGAADRRIYWPRGKALGGSSSINAVIYMRPNPLDLDRWAYEENATGWSFAETLPYFKRSETYHPNDDYPADELAKYRGLSGPLHVTGGKLRNERYSQFEVCRAFIEAGKQAGLAYSKDLNGYRQEGVGWFDSTFLNGSRMSTAATYLKLALQTNANRVHLRTNSLSTKLLFNDAKRVIGVETADASDRTKLTRVYARKDVILSAGSINSPQLLQLSGIGDADDLRKLGITVNQHLPGVGRNLQDHLRVPVVFESVPSTAHRLRDPEYEKAVVGEWIQSKSGIGASNGLECGAHFRTSEQIKHPNVQIHFSITQFTDVPGVRMEQTAVPSVALFATMQRAASRGHVKIVSADPFQYPEIDPRLFSDPIDIVEAADAIKFCRNIVMQKAFDPFRKGLLEPTDDITTDKQIQEFARQKCETTYHPVGTCKMGDASKDPLAVVDPLSLRVFGVDGLRVIDASVMPSEPSSNLNAPVIMIAEKASDLILGKKLLAPENVPFYRSA